MCIVYSDTEVREWLTNMHHIPEKSYKLYYGKYGFQDFQSFIAFSATREDCLQYLNNFINSNKMQASTELEDWIAEFPPEKHRPDLDHSNWDLSQDKEYLRYKDSRGTVFLYDEEISRVYVCKPI